MKLKTIGYAAFVAVAAGALIIGSAGTGEAKSKKKAAAPSSPVICTWDWKPVCAIDHGVKHTFTNACIAHSWGAKVIYPGECGAKPKMHHKKAAAKAAPAKAAPAKKEEKKK
jgi:hypothetical protein